jgi:chromosome partitioning protein
MRIIAIANQKGGCGKTTTAVNLSVAFTKKGHRVLLIDLDPQGHATLGLGFDPEVMDKTIYDVMTNPQVPITTVAVGTKIDGLWLVPSNILLSGAEVDLAPVQNREYILSNALNCASNSFDLCIIDCSPSLGLLTLNALVASSEVIIPVQAHYYALEGLKQLLGTISIVRERFNPGLKIRGILLTFMEGRTTLCKQIQRQMKEFFDNLMFRTVIHRSIRLAEAPSAGESVLTYAPGSKGAVEYNILAQEVYNGKV